RTSTPNSRSSWARKPEFSSMVFPDSISFPITIIPAVLDIYRTITPSKCPSFLKCKATRPYTAADACSFLGSARLNSHAAKGKHGLRWKHFLHRNPHGLQRDPDL